MYWTCSILFAYFWLGKSLVLQNFLWAFLSTPTTSWIFIGVWFSTSSFGRDSLFIYKLLFIIFFLLLIITWIFLFFFFARWKFGSIQFQSLTSFTFIYFLKICGLYNWFLCNIRWGWLTCEIFFFGEDGN